MWCSKCFTQLQHALACGHDDSAHLISGASGLLVRGAEVVGGQRAAGHLAAEAVPAVQGAAEGLATVGGGGWSEVAGDWVEAAEFVGGDAVQCNAAGEAQVAQVGGGNGLFGSRF